MTVLDGSVSHRQVRGLAGMIADSVAAAVAALPPPDAADVTFTPDSDVTSTNVQAAILEVYAAIADQLAAAIAAIPDPAAADVTFTPGGEVASSNVQDAILEVRAAIDTQLAALVDSAPGVLDTLNELAAALGDDANFAATMTDALATKLDADDFWTLLKAAILPGAHMTVDVDETARTLTLVGPAPGGGSGGVSLMPWTTVGPDGEPTLLWDDDNNLMMVEVP